MRTCNSNVQCRKNKAFTKYGKAACASVWYDAKYWEYSITDISKKRNLNWNKCSAMIAAYQEWLNTEYKKATIDDFFCLAELDIQEDK